MQRSFHSVRIYYNPVARSKPKLNKWLQSTHAARESKTRLLVSFEATVSIAHPSKTGLQPKGGRSVRNTEIETPPPK